jgi:hypothetical protein
VQIIVCGIVKFATGGVETLIGTTKLLETSHGLAATIVAENEFCAPKLVTPHDVAKNVCVMDVGGG